MAVSIASAGTLAIAAAGVGIAVLVSGSADAQVQPPSRFHAAPEGSVPYRLPFGAGNAPTTVVVELAGDPVTVQDANSATPLSKADKAARRGQLRNAQVPVEASIKALGGKVTGSYQLTYNGIRVSIPARQASKLLGIKGVVAVHTLQTFTPDNTHGIPFIGAPAAWDGVAGFHGEGVKIAVIDTGIDWTHADFGGPGTAAAYTAAHANETAPADPAYFGPNAPKVKGGIDLVGDSYNANPTSPSYQPVPHPDPNPLDCFGHGSHVAGTAAGFGVLADGTTYQGAYDANTVNSHNWLVGPGVAPKADIYSIRVFGCEGSTDVTIDAIEWAVDHDMDVINMSLGSPFGSADDPSAVASTNAAKDGVIVVASSGNNGFAGPYLTGSPASGSGVISVAAVDPTEGFAGAQVALSTGPTLTAINANGFTPLPAGPLPVFVMPGSNPSTIGLGCHLNPDGTDFDDVAAHAADVAGKVLVVARGTCARVAKAIFGQKAGALAVIMVNNATSLPPFEGPITGNPDPGGEAFNVTIPFLGVSSTATDAMVAANGGTVTLTSATISNPGFRAAASFTSGGPRVGDSALKPDVAAPGVSIASVGIGTGNGFAFNSGTSMAAPHTAGLAALVKQAHPSWKKVEYFKAAIVNTADPGLVNGYSTAIEGAGLIQAPAATQTQVVALGDKGTSTLSFGFAELSKNYSKSKGITVKNLGNSTATFNVSSTLESGSAHSVTISPSTVTIGAGGSADITVTLNVPVATAPTASGGFGDVAGLIVLTPTGGSNHGVALRVPYYLVPQSVSNIDTKLDTKALVRTGAATATVTNKNGATTGIADWYAWGLTDGKDAAAGSADVSAVGVQAFPGVVVFAVGVNQRSSTFADKEIDIYVDVNGDGTDDYLVASVDLGAVTTGTSSGQVVVDVVDLRTGIGSIQFFADAPADGTTNVLPVLISQLCRAGSPCLNAANPRFSYHAVSFNLSNGVADEVDGVAKFNAFSPSISTGAFDTVAPGGSATESIAYDAAEFATTPALGFLVVSHDNAASGEFETISIK